MSAGDKSSAAWVRLERSLTNQSPDREQLARIGTIREYAKDLGANILGCCPDSWEKSLAITHLEETVMWAVKSIILNTMPVPEP